MACLREKVSGASVLILTAVLVVSALVFATLGGFVQLLWAAATGQSGVDHSAGSPWKPVMRS
jgi:hypothetical protein